MKRVGTLITDELDRRLKAYVIRKTGSLHGQGEIIAKAIEEYLDRHEPENGGDARE